MPTTTFENLSEENRQKFLDAALEEFTENTYEKASIRHLCAKAGLSVGGFYCYFSSKEELYIYLLDRMHILLFRQKEEQNCTTDEILARDPQQAAFWESFSRSSMDILGKYYLRTSSYGLYPEELNLVKKMTPYRPFSEMEERFVTFVLSSMVYTIYKFCEEENLTDPAVRDVLWNSIKDIIYRGYQRDASPDTKE